MTTIPNYDAGKGGPLHPSVKTNIQPARHLHGSVTIEKASFSEQYPNYLGMLIDSVKDDPYLKQYFEFLLKPDNVFSVQQSFPEEQMSFDLELYDIHPWLKNFDTLDHITAGGVELSTETHTDQINHFKPVSLAEIIYLAYTTDLLTKIELVVPLIKFNHKQKGDSQIMFMHDGNRVFPSTISNFDFTSTASLYKVPFKPVGGEWAQPKL